jgi:hypothetical protein
LLRPVGDLGRNAHYGREHQLHGFGFAHALGLSGKLVPITHLNLKAPKHHLPPRLPIPLLSRPLHLFSSSSALSSSSFSFSSRAREKKRKKKGKRKREGNGKSKGKERREGGVKPPSLVPLFSSSLSLSSSSVSFSPRAREKKRKKKGKRRREGTGNSRGEKGREGRAFPLSSLPWFLSSPLPFLSLPLPFPSHQEQERRSPSDRAGEARRGSLRRQRAGEALPGDKGQERLFQATKGRRHSPRRQRAGEVPASDRAGEPRPSDKWQERHARMYARTTRLSSSQTTKPCNWQKSVVPKRCKTM